MKKVLYIVIFIALLSDALMQSKYNVHYYKDIDHTEEISTIEISKGVYQRLYLSFTQTEPLLSQLKGKLALSTEPFILSDEIVLDMLKERLVPIMVGVSCDSTVTSEEYSIEFNVMEGEQISDKVSFAALKIKINSTPTVLDIKVPLSDIAAGSYGIYYVESTKVFNVNPITIQVERTEGRLETVFNNLDIPLYNKLRESMFLKSTFSTPTLTLLDKIGEQKGKITLTNSCFKSNVESITFTINKGELATINEEIKMNLINTLILKEHNKNGILMTIKMITYPVLISCSIQSKIESIEELLPILRHMNNYINKTDENFIMNQQFITATSEVFLSFEGLNRWEKNHEILCLIEDTNAEESLQKSINFVIENNLVMNQFNQPQPSQCGIWSFASDFKNKRLFGTKALDYCSQFFASYNRDKGFNKINDNGCIQCDLNHNYLGTFDNPHKAICIRNRYNCPSNFKDDNQWKEVFNDFITTINTVEDIKGKLGLDTPQVEITILLDNDIVKQEAIKNKYKNIDQQGNEFSFIAMNQLDRTINCQIKKKAYTYPESSLIDNEFFKHDAFSVLFSPKQSIEITLGFDGEKKPIGFDDQPYNVIFRCYSMEYEGSYYKGTSFIPLSILRTSEELLDDAPVPKEDCKAKPHIPECLSQTYYEPLTLENYYMTPIKSDSVKSFKYLYYSFKKTMISIEMGNYQKLVDKSDILDKTYYITQLLSLLNCKSSPDYQTCRNYKKQTITALIDKFIIKDLQCEKLIDTIKDISSLNIYNIIVYLMTLFQLGNNPESYDKNSFQTLFDITHCLLNQNGTAFNVIDNYYLDNKEKALNTKTDYIQLLLTHSTNLIDLIHYAEEDKLINVNKETNIIEDPLIERLNTDIRVLVQILHQTKSQKITYSNIHVMNFRKTDFIDNDNLQIRYNNDSTHHLRQLASEPKILNVESLGIKVTVQPYDLFTTTKAEFLCFYVLKHYPLIGNEHESLSPTTFSFSALDINYKRIKNPDCNAAPKIRYDYRMHNETYAAGYQFDSKEKIFILKRTEYNSFGKLNEKTDIPIYGEISILSVGDFTLGINTTSMVWLIIVLSIVGVIIFGALIYFIITCFRKKAIPTVDASPLIQEDIVNK